MAKAKIQDTEEKSEFAEPKEYELGFLLNPIISPEEVVGFVNDKIKTQIGGVGGEIITSSDPKMRKLAYPVKKSVENKISTFKDGYFGSIKFKAKGEGAKALTEHFAKIPEVIRSIIINSSSKNQAPTKPVRRFTKRQEVGATDKPKEEMTEKVKEVIDKEIEEMVA